MPIGTAGADAEDHVTHLADRVIGEQALVVFLHQGHHDREDDRHGADDHEHGGYPGLGSEGEQVEGDAGEEVDAQQLVDACRQEWP